MSVHAAPPNRGPQHAPWRDTATSSKSSQLRQPANRHTGFEVQRPQGGRSRNQRPPAQDSVSDEQRRTAGQGRAAGSPVKAQHSAQLLRPTMRTHAPPSEAYACPPQPLRTPVRTHALAGFASPSPASAVATPSAAMSSSRQEKLQRLKELRSRRSTGTSETIEVIDILHASLTGAAGTSRASPLTPPSSGAGLMGLLSAKSQAVRLPMINVN